MFTFLTSFARAAVIVTLLTTPFSISGGVIDEVESEIQCLAANIYYEARGESLKGRIAVGNVTLNRSKSPSFPSSVCAVVNQKHKKMCQFSWVCTKATLPAIKEELYAEIENLASKLYKGDLKDVTKGATHFHNNEVSPEWSYKYKATVHIGKHIFYKR